MMQLCGQLIILVPLLLHAIIGVLKLSVFFADVTVLLKFEID